VYRRSLFDRFARTTSSFTGHPIAFAVAGAIIVAWIIFGPIFGFSDTWQLVINTATTIVTFLMVFLIQNTQNRDGAAIQLKLDELIRASRGAHMGCSTSRSSQRASSKRSGTSTSTWRRPHARNFAEDKWTPAARASSFLRTGSASGRTG
jgi:low affinity Fe/Cu permease